MGTKEILIILVIVLLIFGTKKLRAVGSDLGAAVRDFKKSMSEGERDADAKQLTHELGNPPPPPESANQTHDAEFPSADKAGGKPKTSA